MLLQNHDPLSKALEVCEVCEEDRSRFEEWSCNDTVSVMEEATLHHMRKRWSLTFMSLTDKHVKTQLLHTVKMRNDTWSVNLSTSPGLSGQ